MQDGETHVDGPFGGRGEDAPTLTAVRCPAHWEISQDRRLRSPHLGAMQDRARLSWAFGRRTTTCAVQVRGDVVLDSADEHRLGGLLGRELLVSGLTGR